MNRQVSLRDIEDGDLPILFEQHCDPAAVRTAAFPAREREAFMSHWARSRADPTAVLKTILYYGLVAGNIVSWERHGERRVGYWLGREYWGKGIATEALAQLLEEVKPRPIHARVAKHNIASIRVLQKCGFTIRGQDNFSGAGGL